MEQQASYSVANFAAKFCNELGTDKTSICSPLSAEILLALLALGCRNKAHTELLKALDMTDDDAIRSSYGFIISNLKSIQGATLNLANKVYLKKGGELKPGIEKDAKDIFQSSLDQLDFINEKEAAVATINKWVAQQTNDMIKDIVSPQMLKDDTGVVLINAIYFQGFWTNPFHIRLTRCKPFHVNEKTTISVRMMLQKEKYFDYEESKELKAKLLRMEYRGGEASMVIVLPDKIEGLRSMLQKLASGHNIMSDLESMKSTKLDSILIPKFKVETTIDLKKLLPNLGVKSIFDERDADIDMLKSNEKLFVSDAFQKALIIVDENGTEATASSPLCPQSQCARRGVRRFFKADHPFAFLLIARKIPIFFGVYEGSEYAYKKKDSSITATTEKL